MIDYDVGDVVVCMYTHDCRASICGYCGKPGRVIEKNRFFRVAEIIPGVTCLDSGIGVALEGDCRCNEGMRFRYCWIYCSSTFKKPGELKDIFSLAEPRKVKEPNRELVPVDLFESLQERWDNPLENEMAPYV